MEPLIPLIQVDESADEPATPFDTLYHREYHAMVRMATALVDYQEKAEEVVQEAFAQLYMRYAQVDTPVAYVRVSVLNGCRRALRRRRLARALHVTSQRDAESSDELGFNHMLDAVRRLPTTQRNAVTLRYELQLTDRHHHFQPLSPSKRRAGFADWPETRGFQRGRRVTSAKSESASRLFAVDLRTVLDRDHVIGVNVVAFVARGGHVRQRARQRQSALPCATLAVDRHRHAVSANDCPRDVD